MPSVTLPGGERVPAYGQGTWHMGESRGRRAAEIAALRLGIELGVTLIDTAEMYGNGAAEEIVAEAAGTRRDDLFIVSKVLPYNASRQGTIEACEKSLRRLKTDRIDLYLLHWRGSHPFAETLAAFDRLQRDGKIRHHGVSNLDRAEIEEWVRAGGSAVASNQILYNLARRGPEWDLIPWCREHGVPVMAYSPIDQARMLGHKALAEAARRHPGATPAQVALQWLLRQEGMIVIPKASDPGHVRENLAALDLRLTDEDLAALDRAFPPPRGRTSLGML
ncbi:MAG TPA: aldo/keto reductase [Stellaceae bacterium]|nr:aldo/keto reductase [Stellaceae bacterium]